MSQPGVVDWSLAERIAVAFAGRGPSTELVGQEELDYAAGRSVRLVTEYTGLRPSGRLPAAEVVDRPAWIRANLETMRGMTTGLERRMAESLSLPGALGTASRVLAGAATAAEVGVASGYLAQRVLGQYEVALIGPSRPPRLLFVSPNLAEAHAKLGESRDLFIEWIALHESTHAVQFAAVPWLRGHVGGMVEDLLDGVEVRVDWTRVRERARTLFAGDLRTVVSRLQPGELAKLFVDERRRSLIDRIQASMAVVEGYSEHVMDAVGAELDPAYARLRERMERRRDQRNPLEALLARLLGLDMKMSQYRMGKAFSDEVAGRAGVEALNEVWSDPEALPSSEELESPDRWLVRVL